MNMEIATTFEAVSLLKHIATLYVNPWLLVYILLLFGYDSCQNSCEDNQSHATTT